VKAGGAIAMSIPRGGLVAGDESGRGGGGGNGGGKEQCIVRSANEGVVCASLLPLLLVLSGPLRPISLSMGLILAQVRPPLDWASFVSDDSREI
jgi:hypothetical protein